jgi:hypothetical protein
VQDEVQQRQRARRWHVRVVVSGCVGPQVHGRAVR